MLEMDVFPSSWFGETCQPRIRRNEGLSMNVHFVLTLTGPDRVGIVDELTGLLLERGGNVETSRMARLGGEFAVLMLVSMPEEAMEGLREALEGLEARGFKVSTSPARRSAAVQTGWTEFSIEVEGADHEGIIHRVARYLAERGISIESAESESVPAPTSGIPLFAMTAQVVVPPELIGSGWERELEALGMRWNLDVRVVSL